jgi:arylsulfatase
MPSLDLRRALASVLLLVACAACGADVERPNLVLITIDTLRADRMSLYGHERETTPAIDAWARGGTVFDHALAPSSWTLPSMSMLMTGQVRLKTAGQIHPEQRSLAEHLASAGYRTAGIYSNGLLDQEKGFARGMEHFQVFKPRTPEEKGNPWTADQVTDLGLAWLEGITGEPFFLALHYSDPHFPYAPLEGLAFEPYDDPQRREAFRAALPPEHRDEFTTGSYRLLERHSAAYDSEILQTDRHVARVLEWLEREQLADRTLVVLTADHGEGLGQRAIAPGERVHGGPIGRFYLSHGTQLYDEQVRVPLVFVGPQVPAGVRVPAHVSLIDVMPTVLALMHVPVPQGLHGQLLRFDQDHTQQRPVFAYCSRATTVTVEDRWRLHVPRDYRVRDQGARPELYDLAADPLELQPLPDEQRIATLEQQVASWKEVHTALEEGRGLPLSFEKHRKQLAAMGYVWDEMFYEGDLEPPGEEQPAPAAEDPAAAPTGGG